jgi:hypothetical protein
MRKTIVFVLPALIFGGCVSNQEFAQSKGSAELCFEAVYGRPTHADLNELAQRRVQCTPDMLQVGAQVAAQKQAAYRDAISSIGDSIQKVGESRNSKTTTTNCTSQKIGDRIVTTCN